jgi:signal transduction histidine kinase
MLGEIFFVLLVLFVATLMVVDVVRTPSESPHGQADRPAYGAERTVIASSRGPEAVAFSSELAGSVTTVPPLDPPRRPESISPPPGSEPRPGTEPAYRESSGGRRPSSDARSRVALLVIIPAVTAAVVALCVVRIVALLNSTSIHSRNSSVHDSAVVSVILASAVLVIVLALGLWATIRAARSVLRPWQGLQAGGLQEAGSSHETGAPATVFDQMRREIARLTDNEAQLRAKLNAMFVNLSHRNRSLVERQIRIVGNLEHGERDAQRLASLGKINRIAIHLYRNSENLLILAGQEPTTSSNQPVSLSYLVQAAASEIEDGERVSFDVTPDIAVHGPAVGDVVHLVTELIQNATSFSAADMPVYVTGRMQPTGGVLIDITDRGIGMTAKEMAYANWQLENPPATDLDASKWMGLLVVARLAARHRIRVRLKQAGSDGLTALVWLPDEVATYQGAAGLQVSGDHGSAGPASGLPEAAADPGYAADRTTTAARSAELEPPATVRSSGSRPPDATAADASGSGLAARPIGDETAPVGVLVPPPPEDLAITDGPPIYDEVESHWFNSGREAPGSSGPAASVENSWWSPGDDGWQAAQTVDSPSSGGPTAAGLPRRLPNANLVPGSVSSKPAAATPRSAAAARDRLAGLQRGVSEGRAASETVEGDGQDES